MRQKKRNRRRKIMAGINFGISIAGIAAAIYGGESGDYVLFWAGLIAFLFGLICWNLWVTAIRITSDRPEWGEFLDLEKKNN